MTGTTRVPFISSNFSIHLCMILSQKGWPVAFALMILYENMQGCHKMQVCDWNKNHMIYLIPTRMCSYWYSMVMSSDSRKWNAWLLSTPYICGWQPRWMQYFDVKLPILQCPSLRITRYRVVPRYDIDVIREYGLIIHPCVDVIRIFTRHKICYQFHIL